MLNVLLVGAASRTGVLPVDSAVIRGAVEARFSERRRAAALGAFDKGVDWAALPSAPRDLRTAAGD